jgi:hypothetical protein
MPRKPRWRDALLRNDPYIDDFFFIVRDSSVKELESYLENSSDIDLDHIYIGMNSLAIASRVGDLSKVQLLYERGASIFINNSSAVNEAVLFGHMCIFEYLCSKVKEVYGDDELIATYGTCLCVAVKENNFDFIEYLLNNGADPNFQREPRDLRPIDWARSPEKNLDAFLYMLPLTTPRYRKSAMKNMEFFGFEQSLKRANSEEHVLELRTLRDRYDAVVAPYKKSKSRRKRG